MGRFELCFLLVFVISFIFVFSEVYGFLPVLDDVDSIYYYASDYGPRSVSGGTRFHVVSVVMRGYECM
ncbi:MAG: hypothetical protein ABDH28_07085 [Brevinematia bacterium]